MAIPMVRLVGLKVQQLSEEGRQTSVCLSSPLRSEILQAYSPPALCSDNRHRRFSEPLWSALSSPEKSLTAKAAQHVAEFLAVQKQQLRHLVGVVKVVERLVRLQEGAIAKEFQDCDTYLDSLQQRSLVNFKNLHQQVMDMRQKDSGLAYRLRVAEQSYQALMSLAVKIQESGIDKARKNLLNVKVDMEGMLNELASSMCKPLIGFLKQLKGDNDASMVVSKLQRLVVQMNCRVSSEFQTLSAANEEYKGRIKKIDFQLQVCNKEVEKMSLDGEALRRSLKEKAEEVEALKAVLAVEISEKQNYKAQLDSEKVRACQLEEELRRSEIKLANAVELLQATKLDMSYQHLQVTDACTKSREICRILAAAETKLDQTYLAVDTFLYGNAHISKYHEQLKQPQAFSGASRSRLEGGREEPSQVWDRFSNLLSNGMAEMQSSSLDQGRLQEAIVLFSKHCVNQENSGALREVLKALFPFTKHLMDIDNPEARKVENFPSTSLLQEKSEEIFLFWVAEIRHIQDLVQHSQQIQDSREGKSISTDSSNTPASALTLGIWLALFYLLACLMDTFEGHPPTSSYVPGLNTCMTFSQLVNSVAMSTMSKPECAGGQLKLKLKSFCHGLDAVSQQQQEQQRRDVVQHEREVAEPDKPKVELLRIELSSCEQELCGSKPNITVDAERGLCGSKRNITGCLGVNQEMDTSAPPLSAKRQHTHEHAVYYEPQSQMQSGPSTSSAITHRNSDKEGLNNHCAAESQKNSELLLSKGGDNLSTLSLIEDRKGRPGDSSKELWQVLELGASNNYNIETTECSYNGGTTSRELSLATRSNQQISEPLLVLRDVRRPAPSFSKRASPRLLARAASRLLHSPHPSCK